MLFKWYRVDFGASDKEILDWLKANGSDDTKKKFEDFEEAVKGQPVVIKHDVYNWGLNGK